MKPLVFVSCGQHTEAEKRLGRAICALIRDLRPDVEAYFAEDQSTVEGLSNNILKALHRTSGFICVMHRRGDIETPGGRIVTRGSVWVEQEVAITAFMTHVLNRSIPTFFYQENSVCREGIRSVLLMNPRVQFSDESEVLDDLRRGLPSAPFHPFSDYDLEPVITYRLVDSGGGSRHKYMFVADVKNVGNQKINDFLMNVHFPRPFLNASTAHGAADHRQSTDSHICFFADEKRSPSGLYPGQGMRDPLTISYFVDSALWRDREAMRSNIIVELFLGSMKPKKRVLAFEEYQKF